MNVLGNKVYLLLPEIKESKIDLSPELKQELGKENMAKFDKLEVFAVGDTVNKDFIKIKNGDKVLVDPEGLKRSFIIKIDNKDITVVGIGDILHVW